MCNINMPTRLDDSCCKLSTTVVLLLTVINEVRRSEIVVVVRCVDGAKIEQQAGHLFAVRYSLFRYTPALNLYHNKN